MSMLDELGELGAEALQRGLSSKLDDNSQEDEQLRATARISAAHIWAFLAQAQTPDEYAARKGVREDEVRRICAHISEPDADRLAQAVLASFDADYEIMCRSAKAHPPYYLREDGGQFKVVDNIGEVKGTFSTKEEARQQQKALYASVPGAKQKAEEDHGKPPSKAVESVGKPGSKEQRRNEHEGGLRRSAASLVHSHPCQCEHRSHFDGSTSHPYGEVLPVVRMSVEGMGPTDVCRDCRYDHLWEYAQPLSEEEVSGEHLASLRRRAESGDQFGESTLLPQAAPSKNDKDETDDQVNVPLPLRNIPHHGPGLFENPKADQELEDPNTYYGLWGAGGQMNRASALGSRTVVDAYGRIVNVPSVKISPFGRIVFSTASGWAPWEEDPDPDGYYEDMDSGNPELDVYEDFDREEPHYDDDDHWGGYPGGVKERSPQNKVPSTWGSQGHVSARSYQPVEGFDGRLASVAKRAFRLLAEKERKEKERRRERSEGKEEGDEDNEDAGEDDKTKKAPGTPRSGNSKARPSAGRQVKRRSSVTEAALASVSAVDPSEMFSDYWGRTAAPRTAQAPLVGNSAVPQDPESGTGAAGMFNAGAADAGGNFAQHDLPPTQQDLTTGMPGLAHLTNKVVQIASDIRRSNPGVPLSDAVALAAETVRKYPKMAGAREATVRQGAGGADWLPVGEEVLEPCPQCGRDAYNSDVNVCHFCGFYDAGLAPVTTVHKV